MEVGLKHRLTAVGGRSLEFRCLGFGARCSGALTMHVNKVLGVLPIVCKF